jgi:uncharacterized protein (TIGR03083 family)
VREAGARHRWSAADVGVLDVAGVLEAEAAALVAAMTEVPAGRAGLPTRCAPLSVTELLGHVRVTLRTLLPMLAAPEPRARPGSVDAVGPVEYYRPDARFAPDTDAQRLAAAVAAAAEPAGLGAHLTAFDGEVGVLLRAVRDVGTDRLVVTRHGDLMRLADFLVTRVLEVAVHGLDLADALGVRRWTTAAAADLLRRLHLDGPLPDGVADDVAFLAHVTGRDVLVPGERVAWRDRGVRFLTLGG